MKTFAITLTAILAAIAAPALGMTIAQWNLDEGPVGAVPTGAGTILDSVGGHHGTPLGSLIYRGAATGDGGTLGLEFPNEFDRVFIPDSPAFVLTNSLTMEAYIIPPPASSHVSRIFFRGDDRFGFDPYALNYNHANNGRFDFEMQTDQLDRSRLFSPVLTPGVLVHVAATLDGATGEQNLYINHQLVASTVTSIRPLGALDPTMNPGLGIGNTQSGDGGDFTGIIAGVRLSDTALTPDQFLPAVVPEPATLYLLGCALIVMVAGNRRTHQRLVQRCLSLCRTHRRA